MASIQKFEKAVKDTMGKVRLRLKGRLGGEGPHSMKFMRGTHKTSNSTATKNGIMY